MISPLYRISIASGFPIATFDDTGGYPVFNQPTSPSAPGINREVSMLQQQSAIYTARSFALSNGSVDLHNYMVAPWCIRRIR